MPAIEVFGGGIFGLTVAWTLLVRGASVRVIEKRHVGAGASGGLVGALAPHVPDNWNAKKAFQFDSLIAAADFWRAVEQACGVSPGYARTGRLMPLADDRAVELARDRAEAAQVNWRGLAEWRVIPAAEAGPWAPPSATGWLVHETLSARLSPRRTCAALAAAIRARGGEIVEGATRGPGADIAICCTGHEGLAALSADLGREVGRGIRGQALSLRHAAPDAPQIYAEGLHIVPHADGTVAIGSTTERDWTEAGPVTADIAALRERAVKLLPVLHGAPLVEAHAGIRPRGRRRAPILGPWPGRDGVFVANGGFKIGFGVAIEAARVMADLVLDGVDRIPEGMRVEDNL